MTKNDFEKALDFLYPSEGGYTNNKYDNGGPTNMGVTQRAYDTYCKKHHLKLKDVKNISKDEATQLYYEDYWLTSGADNVSDSNMAIVLFDTAVLHGPQKAKEFYNQSNGDINKFLDIRKESYNKIIENNPSQKIFYDGWNNRVENLRTFVENNSNFSDNNDIQSTNKFKEPFQLYAEYNEYLPPEENNHIFTAEEIGKMTTEEFLKNESEINRQLQEGLISPSGLGVKNYADFVNPETGSDKIYTREEIGSLSPDDFKKNEKEIFAQMNSPIGIPTEGELKNAASSGGGVVFVNGYTRSDGVEVKSYYRSSPSN